MNRFLGVLLLALLVPGVAWAQGADAEPPTVSVTPFLRDVLTSDTPVVLEANSLTFNQNEGIYQAIGDVVLIQGENQLHADQMVIDLQAKTLLADGNIRLTGPQGSITAESLHLRLDTETAVVARASFTVVREEATYYLRGRRIEKVGPERYLVHQGHYTTCDCGMDEADWMVTADYIDVTFDGYAVVERGRIYMQGLPVAYVPFGVFPAKINRSTGFLWPETGWSSDDGYHVGLPFYWNINRHSDATLDTDWYQERGTKFGLQHRYMLNRTWQGETNVDYLQQDRNEDGAERWALSHEQRFNPTGRLFFRDRVSLISDNDYVVDFPRDVDGRYDRYIRSDIIANNLWDNYDLNVSVQHWQNLAVDDNSYTFQQYPHAQFNAMSQRIGPLPVFWRVGADAARFYRPKIPDDQRLLDAVDGREHPFLYLTDGQRVTLWPELYAPLNFNQIMTVTPYALGEGTFYQLNDRNAERTPTRGTAETGVRTYTRFERAFHVRRPVLRGIKHQIEPAVAYRYRDEPDQDELPIFDGNDRLPRLSELSYGLTNRLWLRLFDRREKRFGAFKLTDLRVLHGYDFAEAERPLEPLLPEDENRPWLPWRVEWETQAAFGSYLNKVLVRSDAAYDTYQDDVTGFNALGALGTRRDDSLAAEYRYHVDALGEIDISYLSGLARYNLMEFVTLEYLTRYSFLDSYFVEQRYAVELHSLQDCWTLRLNVEQREIPEKETVFLVLADFTGLVKVGTGF